MEPKRYDIIDCLSNGEAIPAHMAENCSGRWLDSKDPAIVQALAIASAASEAGMVDEAGNFRKILGRFARTADGCLALPSARVHHPSGRMGILPGCCGNAPIDLFQKIPGECVTTGQCYSTPEAARSAAEAAAKGAGDAQG